MQGHGRTLAEFSVSALATARRMVERVCGEHTGVRRQGTGGQQQHTTSSAGRGRWSRQYGMA